MKKLIMLLAATIMWAGPVWAGQVVIDGTDANDHGSFNGSVNVNGWLYMQKVLENLAGRLPLGVARVVVDLGTTSGSKARDAIESAFNQSFLPRAGWTLIHVEGDTAIGNWLTGLSTFNTGILYIPTAGNTSGDLTDSELAVINARATKIRDFVQGVFDPTRGGALYSQAESVSGAYEWLMRLIPGIDVTDLGSGGVNTPITLTSDGAATFPGLTNADLAGAVPWHNYFSGSFGSLAVLGTALDNSGRSRNVILGGAVLSTDTTPPSVRVLSPRGGESFTAGQQVAIRWDSSDDIGVVSHDILLSRDGGLSFDLGDAIATGLPGDVQSFDWNLPGRLFTNQARIRVVARDMAGHVGQDDSGVFTIGTTTLGLNCPPGITNLNQYRADTGTVIGPHKVLPVGTVIFRGIVSAPDGGRVKLEIELRRRGESFQPHPNPTDTISSDFVPSGTSVQITRFGLVPGGYHWRARAVYERGGSTAWCPFGTSGLDFRVGVPVVLVHGWCGRPDSTTWNQLEPLLARDLFSGDSLMVHYANYGSDRIGDIKELADELARDIQSFKSALGLLQNDKIDIIAHSMGGLVARAWIARLGTVPYNNDVRRLITAATPHFGTPFAAWEVYPTLLGFCDVPRDIRAEQVGQMAYGSSFIWELYQEWQEGNFVSPNKDDILTIVATDDGIVPVASAALLDVLRRWYVDKNHFGDGGVVNVPDDNYSTYKIISSFLRDHNDPMNCNDCSRTPPDPDSRTGMVLMRLLNVSETAVNNATVQINPGLSITPPPQVIRNGKAGTITLVGVPEGSNVIVIEVRVLGQLQRRVMNVLVTGAQTTILEVTF